MELYEVLFNLDQKSDFFILRVHYCNFILRNQFCTIFCATHVYRVQTCGCKIGQMASGKQGLFGLFWVLGRWLVVRLGAFLAISGSLFQVADG